MTPGRRRLAGASRRWVLATGVAVVAVYVATAWFSGRLSPLARQPLLDGLIPPAPYRWVDPPPELAPTNVEPAAETATIELGNRGSATAIVSTDDAQVTVVLPRGAFAPARSQTGVRVRIEPLAEDAAEAPDPPLRILGNLYRLRASYVPSGDPAALDGDARVVLVYPFISTDHSEHAVIVSADGETWSAVETNDFRSIQQADGPIETLGFAAVAQTGETASPTASADGGVDVATIGIVAGLVALAAGAALALRPARSATSQHGDVSKKRSSARTRRDEGKVGRGRPNRPGRGAARGSRPRRGRSR